MQIVINSDGYITASCPSSDDGSGLVGAIEVADDKIPSDFAENQAFYRLENNELVFDSEYKSKIISGIQRANRIEELHAKLYATDYIAAKIAEGAATRDEYADKLAERQAWRDEINQLESI